MMCSAPSAVTPPTVAAPAAAREIATASPADLDRLRRIMADTCAFYTEQLWTTPGGAPARAYLARRGLTEATCREFGLGWAPGHHRLLHAAQASGDDLADLARLDLAVERQGRLADRFFERITFPICDPEGRPIGISARILPEAADAAKAAGRSVGKYVNSTTTPLYHKSEVVWNLHRAAGAQRLIVMEGQTDVMAATQANIPGCVAVLGTALTAQHARQLHALSSDLVLLLDGDAAGREQGLRAATTCLTVGVPVRLALLPQDLDPAEALAEGAAGDAGRSLVEQALANAQPALPLLLANLVPDPATASRHQHLDAVDDLAPVLAGGAAGADADEQVARWLRMPESVVRQRLRSATGRPDAAAAVRSAADLARIRADLVQRFGRITASAGASCRSARVP
jgi:DNA primase